MTATEADALIREIEEQRNFLGARAAKFAASNAALTAEVKKVIDANNEKQQRIEALQAEVEGLKARVAALEPHDVAGQE